MKYLFSKQIEIVKLCKEKIDEIRTKHPFLYLWKWSKFGRRWNYYMSVYSRALKEAEEEIK